MVAAALALTPIRLVAAAVALACLTTVSGQAQEKDPGRTAFARAGCEFCHGRGARGGAVGVALVPYAKTAAELLTIVREGIGTMPPMSADTVSDADVAAIHAYLRKISAPSGGDGADAISSADVRSRRRAPRPVRLAR